MKKIKASDFYNGKIFLTYSTISEFLCKNYPEMSLKDARIVQHFMTNGTIEKSEHFFKNYLPDVIFDKDYIIKLEKARLFLKSFIDKHNLTLNAHAFDVLDKMAEYYNITVSDHHKLVNSDLTELKINIYQIFEKHINARELKLERILKNSKF